ncbi:MAG TPA: DNA-binding domain-containing protein [Steroidobacteraceae bacterium]|nr:DNA-binding domain-containing protein [Steroidobacteraceae bacterium]
MTRLAHLQGQFQEYLLRGTPGIEAHVVGSARVPVETRLAIYAGAYGSRLIDALAANYPALAALLGEEDFRALGAKYVSTHDSPYFSIRHYGESLADFLAGHRDYADVPLLAELARWEWQLSEVFDAADAEPLSGAALGHIAPADWAQLRFTWHPSVRRIALSWNAPQLWKALTDESERPELSVRATPVEWLAWRSALRTWFRSLEPLEARCVDAARSGRSFGELCELLAAARGAQAAPAAAAGLLRGWLAEGLIVAAVPA